MSELIASPGLDKAIRGALVNAQHAHGPLGMPVSSLGKRVSGAVRTYLLDSEQQIEPPNWKKRRRSLVRTARRHHKRRIVLARLSRWMLEHVQEPHPDDGDQPCACDWHRNYRHIEYLSRPPEEQDEDTPSETR